VFAALIVRGRAEPASRRAFEFDALEIAIKGKVEIEASLFAIGDDVESSGDLIVNGGNDGIFLEFGSVGFAELVEMRTGEFEPTGEGVAADDGGAERVGSHVYTLKG
jgi:hypothetical protein